MRRFYAILRAELKLSIRGMDMIIFATCMPLVAISLLGIIFGSRPAYPGAGYTFLEQSFGAAPAITACAGGVVGLLLMISEYRQREILKRCQMTPASPTLLLAVQITVYTVYSLASLVLVYATAVLFFGTRFPGSAAAYLAVFLFVMLVIFSIGMMIGGVAPDIRTAGIWASMLYFPMLVLSGATLPYETMPSDLQRITDMMPLTQGIKLLRAVSLGLLAEDIWKSCLYMAVCFLVYGGIALRYFGWEQRRAPFRKGPPFQGIKLGLIYSGLCVKIGGRV